MAGRQTWNLSRFSGVSEAHQSGRRQAKSRAENRGIEGTSEENWSGRQDLNL